MRKTILTGLLLALSLAPEALAHRRVRVGVHVWWPWWDPWWWGPVVVRPVTVEARALDLAVVDTDVEPEHARVYLDGQLVGTADDFDGHPDYLYLRPGRYTLEFSLPGYERERVEIDAQPGRFFPLDLKLTPKPGEKAAPWYDRPEGVPGARVFGKDRKTAAASPPHADPSLRPELAPRERRDTAQERKGSLRFTVEPENAAVYLDGEFLGTAGELAAMVRPLAVEAGEHQVEVVAPGFSAEKLTVRVDAGGEVEIRVQLHRQD